MRSVEQWSVDGHEFRDEVVAESSRQDVDVATSRPAMLTLDGGQVASDEVARCPTTTVERAGVVDVVGSETTDHDDVQRDDEQRKNCRRRAEMNAVPATGQRTGHLSGHCGQSRRPHIVTSSKHVRSSLSTRHHHCFHQWQIQDLEKGGPTGPGTKPSSVKSLEIPARYG